jgi:hypothetical protein
MDFFPTADGGGGGWMGLGYLSTFVYFYIHAFYLISFIIFYNAVK